MNLQTLQNFLLWAAVINYGILILWFVLFRFVGKPFYELVSKLFCRLPETEFDKMNFLGIMFYKLANILFFLVPYIALRIVG